MVASEVPLPSRAAASPRAGVTILPSLCDKALRISSSPRTFPIKMADPAPCDLSMPIPPVERLSAYDRYGPEVPPSPVVISVPHAGRAYPPELLAQARVAPAALRRLEDRFADLLLAGLADAGCALFVARAPRAMIDLNRGEREVDPAMVRDMPHGQPLIASAKLRGGLGLIPRRLAGVGDLWLQPLPWSAVTERIDTYHRPYHAALADMMERVRTVHGHAILLDIHSMPPLPPTAGRAARIVLGDRFGASASSRLIAMATELCAGRGIATAQNHPYPGSYLLERHGHPERGMHALQVEVDRSLYLDPALDRPGPGLPAMQALITDLVAMLAQALPGATFAQAAE